MNALGGVLAPWLGVLTGEMPWQVAAGITATSVVNIAIRFATKQPISIGGQ